MKKVFFLLLSVLLIAGALQAQDPAIKKDLGEAKRALAAFTLDQMNNKPKLKEAKEAIDRVMAMDQGKAFGGAWQLKGDIYNEIASQIIQVRQLNLGKMEDLPQVDNPAAEAFTAYKKAFEMAVKGGEKKDALKGLQLAQSNLSNLGIFQYEDQEYGKAYDCFNDVLEAHDILKANAEKSSLDAEADYNNQIYISGLAALNSNKKAEAKKHFGKLYDMKYDKAAVYEAMYTLHADADLEGAAKYLDEGRKRYPEDISLLFALINHDLKTGHLEDLLKELEEAIKKEPDNVSLYSVLGNVYDNLYQKSFEKGDQAKADEYFAKALEYYTQATQKDPKFVDAIYSIGALYYNRAAVMTQQMNKLTDDYSKEGIKKYEELRTKVFSEFEKALPYFKKAESLDPNDVNTLIALKEIFAKENKIDLSSEFKRRLEVVQGGGKNDTSYFKE